MPPLLLLLLLLPLPFSAAQAALQCDSVLCFSGVLNDGAVLQRAPAHAAVLGSVPPASPANAPLTLTLSGTDGAGAAYNKSFGLAAFNDFTWKLVLPDAFVAAGNFTVEVACPSCAGGVTRIWRTNITFGDVWLISGQSNAQLGMWSSFRQNEMDARALTGEFEWLRMWGSTNAGTNISGNWMQTAAPSGSCRNASWAAPGLGDGLGESVGSRWCTPLDLMSPRPGDNGAPWFWQASQIGFFFAISLRELLVEAGIAPPPMGIMINAVGGTMAEQWVSLEAQGSSCINVTCLGPGLFEYTADPYQPIYVNGAPNTNCTSQNGAGGQTTGGQGGLWNAMVQPLLNMTIRGLVFYQGENNVAYDMGNVRDRSGYACLMKTLVASYRQAWSAVPGTTDPAFPIGFVSIADGSEEGWGYTFSALHWAQTASHGTLPNSDMPGTFIGDAWDCGDPWAMDSCWQSGCCVEKTTPLGEMCEGDFRGNWTNLTHSAGRVHPRAKDLVGRRLAQAAFASSYKPDTPLLAQPPVLSGCSVSADGATLTLRFNAALLKGERMIVSKPPLAGPLNRTLQNTALYVLSSASLNLVAIAAGHHNATQQGYKGCYENGNEYGVEGWRAVMPSQTAASNEVLIDLAPLNGAAPTAVRYGAGAGFYGSFAGGNAAICCGPYQELSYAPCPPNSCPLKSSASATASATELPATPFVAAIVSGRCVCVPPQECSN